MSFGYQLIFIRILPFLFRLEKSRIIEQTSGERNFHVFYLFYCGMENLERKNDFGLGDAAEHRLHLLLKSHRRCVQMRLVSLCVTLV